MMGIGALTNYLGAKEASKPRTTETNQTTTRTPGLGTESALNYIVSNALFNHAFQQPDIEGIMAGSMPRLDALWNLPTGRTGVGDGWTPPSGPAPAPFMPSPRPEGALPPGLGGIGGLLAGAISPQMPADFSLPAGLNIPGPDLSGLANAGAGIGNQQIQPHGYTNPGPGLSGEDFGAAWQHIKPYLEQLLNPMSLFSGMGGGEDK